MPFESDNLRSHDPYEIGGAERIADMAGKHAQSIGLSHVKTNALLRTSEDITRTAEDAYRRWWATLKYPQPNHPIDTHEAKRQYVATFVKRYISYVSEIRPQSSAAVRVLSVSRTTTGTRYECELSDPDRLSTPFVFELDAPAKQIIDTVLDEK